MNTTIRLCNRHTLHTMGAAFIFHAAECSLASDNERHILDATLVSLISIKYLNLPTASIGIAAVHAEQFSGEEGGFIPTCTSLNGNDSIFLIHTIFGQEQQLHLCEYWLLMGLQ